MTADFWRQVDVREMRECWLWQGTEANSYGFFRNETAHRFAWSFIYGEIPRGLFILHSCDTPLCVNPRHLRAGTHEENSIDRTVLTRVRATLAGAERGAVERRRILDAPTVSVPDGCDKDAIHDRLKTLRQRAGLTLRDVARRCGVDHTAVSHWENGVSAPKRVRLPAVAAALGVTVGELLGLS